MKRTYNYRIYNYKTGEVFEEGVTPPYAQRVIAHNWVSIQAMNYPLYERAIKMRTGNLD